MSKKTLYALSILLVIAIGSILYWYLCCCVEESGVITKEEKTTVDSPKVLASDPLFAFPFSIKDTLGEISYTTPENFVFKESGFRVYDSVPNAVVKGIGVVKQFLDTSENKILDIIGYYKSSEQNNSSFPNLGLARAHSIKEYMVSQGVASEQLHPVGVLDENLAVDSGRLHGIVTFNVTTIAKEVSDRERLKSNCEAMKKNSVVIYFETGAVSLDFSDKDLQVLKSFSTCVEELGATLQVVGHTDSTGDPEVNQKIGYGRANFVKEYLVNNKMVTQNIVVVSRGQNEPIADNTTQEGRAKNRRIVISIK